MAEELREMNIDLTWDEFGDATEKDIDRLLYQRNIEAAKGIKIRSLWKNHPKQIAGKS
jgi:hypothetical protein